MNAFYASVEALFHPEVRGKPMAVAGDEEKRRGIILAKSEEAKRMGVQTAEPIWQARRKCPGLILLPPHRELYRAYSQKANAIYGRYTDMVEPVSIDESFLDVTGSQRLFGSGEQIADSIRAAVRDELGLTVSVGVSFCRIFAKMGSDYKKPDATTVITRQNYPALLYPLPVTSLLYVGEATAKTLRGIGVQTIGDLAALSERMLVARLGKQGGTLYRYVHGLDDEPVRDPNRPEEVKSIGNGITFSHNLTSWEDVRTGVLPLAESVAARLRRHGLKCCGVQVAIKDPSLKTIDRQRQLPRPTHLTREIYAAALGLIGQNWSPGQPIRLLTVTAIHLVEAAAGEQLSLFSSGEDTARLEALDHSLDQLREKFGRGAIRPASILKNDLGIDA